MLHFVGSTEVLGRVFLAGPLDGEEPMNFTPALPKRTEAVSKDAMPELCFALRSWKEENPPHQETVHFMTGAHARAYLACG